MTPSVVKFLVPRMDDFEFVALAHFDFQKRASARSESEESGGNATEPIELSSVVRTL